MSKGSSSRVRTAFWKEPLPLGLCEVPCSPALPTIAHLPEIPLQGVRRNTCLGVRSGPCSIWWYDPLYCKSYRSQTLARIPSFWSSWFVRHTCSPPRRFSESRGFCWDYVSRAKCTCFWQGGSPCVNSLEHSQYRRCVAAQHLQRMSNCTY